MNEDQKKRIEEEKAALNKIRTSVKAGGGPIKPLYGIPLPPKPLYAAPLYGIPI